MPEPLTDARLEAEAWLSGRKSTTNYMESSDLAVIADALHGIGWALLAAAPSLPGEDE